MKEDMIEFLSEVFLFQGISKEEIRLLFSDITTAIAEYRKGENIFLPEHKEEKIGFILSGECLVERVKTDGDAIPLNTLTKYGSFGILSILSVDDYPTRIKASKDTRVLFINKKDALGLMENSSAVAMNVIKFLSNKIGFLNKKIATFSSDTVLQKLARHIYSLYQKSSSPLISFNCKRAAESLNSGRASVYRALDSLSNSGIITFESKKIYINDPIGLERISK